MEAMGETPDDRVQGAVARSRPVKAYVDAHWPALDAGRQVFRLLSDADFLARQPATSSMAGQQASLPMA